MKRIKLFGSSLHNVSKKRQEEMASGTWKPKPRKALAKISKKSASEWNKARMRCLANYNYKCALCGSEENLCVHHIILRTLEPKLKYEQDNLCCLCSQCHKHSGYDKNYITLTKKLIALGLGDIYNLDIDTSGKRIIYERNMERI